MSEIFFSTRREILKRRGHLRKCQQILQSKGQISLFLLIITSHCNKKYSPVTLFFWSLSTLPPIGKTELINNLLRLQLVDTYCMLHVFRLHTNSVIWMPSGKWTQKQNPLAQQHKLTQDYWKLLDDCLYNTVSVCIIFRCTMCGLFFIFISLKQLLWTQREDVSLKIK